MNILHDDWVLTIGQAGSGKTTFICQHIRAIPPDKAFILDYNHNDYTEFHDKYNTWLPTSGSKAEMVRFLKVVYNQGNCFVILEEADNYLGFSSTFIERFVNTARNRGIGAIVSAKRAKSVRPVFRNRFTHLILFRTTLKDDIKYISEWAGVDESELEHIRNLDVGYFVHVDLVTSVIHPPQKLNIH